MVGCLIDIAYRCMLLLLLFFLGGGRKIFEYCSSHDMTALDWGYTCPHMELISDLLQDY